MFQAARIVLERVQGLVNPLGALFDCFTHISDWVCQETGDPVITKPQVFHVVPQDVDQVFGNYSWIGRQIRADNKSICQRTIGATTLSRPPLESSRRGESRSAVHIFSDHFLTSYFLKQVKAWPQQKYAQQIWIRLVE